MINNDSFESFTGPAIYEDQFGVYSIGGISGWNTIGMVGAWSPTSIVYTSVPDGNSVAWVHSGSISQVLSETLNVGTYDLKIFVGNRINYDFPGYSVELYAGDNLLATSNSLIPDDGTFALLTLEYLAEAGNSNLGNALKIVLTGLGHQTNFDKISLDYTSANQDLASVPEPAIILLLGLGLACLAGFRRKFK